MREPSDHHLPYETRGLWRQQVQVARGHWRRDEAAGSVRSAGWWESVTVTWAPAPAATAPEQRPAVLRRALAVAADAITPLLADAAVAGAIHLLSRRRGSRQIASSLRRQLASAARELPRPDQTRRRPGSSHA